MNRQLMAVALAGSLGLAGALAPRAARAQDADDAPGAPGDTCGCEPGGAGPGGMHHPGMMGGPGGPMMHQGAGGPGHMTMGHGLALGPIWRLDLSDAQREQLRKLATDYRKANWNTIGALIDARTKLRDLRAAAQPDPKQVGAAFADVSKLEQTLLEAGMQARNQAVALLTPAQRQQLETWRKEGRGPGGGPHHQGRHAPTP